MTLRVLMNMGELEKTRGPVVRVTAHSQILWGCLAFLVLGFEPRLLLGRHA